MKYLSSSEFVSHGHPDRLADNLAAIVIDDIQKKDGVNSHAAIEVFITHEKVIFAGEATTTLNITPEYLKEVVKKGYERSGYIPQMRSLWADNEVVLAEDVQIENAICAQSPDIALGTTDKGAESGWNDQGVYFSSSELSSDRQGAAMRVAKFIGDCLSSMSLRSILGAYVGPVLGPDNKVVATVEVGEDGFTPTSPKAIKAITIAVAHTANSNPDEVREAVKKDITTAIEANELWLGTGLADDCTWVINGTGRFVVHGAISDTSMTGRKISVNHPTAGPIWSNKMIGGGSLVKPWHASDLILNIASRYIANIVVASGITKYAVVGCSGAIGQTGLQSIFIKGDKNFEVNEDVKENIYKFFAKEFKWSPVWLATELEFFKEGFDFGKVVDQNFFGCAEEQPWERPDKVYYWANKLFDYLKKEHERS